MLKYIELKEGPLDRGPAWIARVTLSKSGRTVYFNGKALKQGTKKKISNYIDLESGDEYWVSGVKKEGTNRHWAGSGIIEIEESVVAEYLAIIGETKLDRSRFKVISDLPETDIQRLYHLENAPEKNTYTQEKIKEYFASHAEQKRSEIQALHEKILSVKPDCRQWFLDGLDANGKVVSNPNIGYGALTISYANGDTKEFYQIGICGNTAGISVYIMGIEDKKYLAQAYGKELGKASVTGYCIKFKTLKDINMDVLEEAIRFGFENTS